MNANGQTFDYLTNARALEILRASTHLSLTVKNNLLGEKMFIFVLKFTLF